MEKKKDLLIEYLNRFNESFNIFAPIPEGKTIDDVLEESLKENKPYHPDMPDNVIY